MRVDPSIFRQLASETEPVVGFCPPESVENLYTNQHALYILALIIGKKTKVGPGSGEQMRKELHGEAVIVQREDDGRVFAIPNDMRLSDAPLKFTVGVARRVVPENLYSSVLQAISLNITHRRDKFQQPHELPRRGHIYP